jgi:hypothetical protein
VGQESALGISDGKVTLVFPHGGDQDFPGKGEEFLGKASAERHGIFYEVGHNLHEVVVGHIPMPAAPNFRELYLRVISTLPPELCTNADPVAVATHSLNVISA